MQTWPVMETLRLAAMVTTLLMASCSGENTTLDATGGSSGGGHSSSGGGSSSGGSSSGGSSSGGSSSGGSDAGVDSAPDAATCIDPVPSAGSGHHNPGQDCLACHQSLSASIRWTVAGTLYSAATGGTAVTGATIEVVDAKGKTLKLATANNGNFYTTTAVSFPLKVRASKCPADMAMTGAVSHGSCNAGGCHTSAMRIHLP